jgi:hypothetical protein
MRCKLLTIIKNWEASGQGDGGMDQDDEQQDENGGGVDRELDGRGEQELDNENAEATMDEIGNDNNNDSSSMAPTFGSLRQRPARSLDSRAAFLRGMPSYILYYWEVADSQQLLSSCLQPLSDHANASDASSAAPVSRRGGMASVRSNVTTSSGGSGRSGGPSSHKQNTDKTDDDEMSKITEN